MGPEFFDEVGGGFVFAGDGEGGTDDVLGNDFHDAAGEGIEAPGVEALLEELFAGVLVSVEFRGVEGGGSDQKLVFGFGKGLAFCRFCTKKGGKTRNECGLFWHGNILAGLGLA